MELLMLESLLKGMDLMDFMNNLAPTTKFRILGKKLLCKQCLTPNKYGRFYAPEQKLTCEATVVSVGDMFGSYFKAGERVIYDPQNVLPFEPAGEHHILLEESQIFGKVENE
jgi:hypothetical protein